MISTVTAEHDPNAKLTDIIRYAFPMGSMTGAPKIRVMEEIESLEDTARGLYSGAVGYFTPEGDFDFNVVIRSIIFEEKSGQIAIQVGSAITYDSDPEEEYRECMLKAETMLQVLMSC
jgi:para-aminobenzoate synthetase component 1